MSRVPLLATIALLSLVACDAQIEKPDPSPFNLVPPPPPPPPPDPVVDAGPPPCNPVPTQVPKLLRLSNFEYRTIASDVLGVPLDPMLFKQWTPVAQVY